MNITTSAIFFIIFLLVLLWLMVSAFRNRVLFRLAYGNFIRKKGSSVIVIMGLMIGTAIISSSFTVGDSFDTLLASQIIDDMQGTDEVYGFQVPGTRGTVDFPMEIYDDLYGEIGGERYIDGMEPQLLKTLSALNNDKDLVEPGVSVAGITLDEDETFGRLYFDGERVDSIPDDMVVLGEDVAQEIDAEEGDMLTLSYLDKRGNYTVLGILDERERGRSSVEIYMNLDELQTLLNLSGSINRIHISNQGDEISGMEYTGDVKERIDEEDVSFAGIELTLIREKKADYDQVFEEGFFFADLLLVFGSFTIIAGVILIINIFTMLGEERRSEMGMARAVGMNRIELRRQFVYEGGIYGIIAAFAGTLVGIVIAYFMVWAIGAGFTGGDASDLVRSFTFTLDSLVLAFSLGFLITISTIYYTTRKISNINIIRAVRNLPEPSVPAKDRRALAWGIVILVLGLVIISSSLAPLYDGEDNDENGTIDDSEEGSTSFFFAGLSLIFLSFVFVLRRFISERWATSVPAILIIIVWALPSGSIIQLGTDFFTFAFAGILMVGATVLLLMANSNLVVALFEKVFAAGGCCIAVTRTALSYSLVSKLRTGLTIAMFSLVIFIITFMSILLAVIGGNIETQIEETSGGFDIMVKMEEPVEDFDTIFNQTGSFDMVEDHFALKSTEVTFNKYSLILDSDQVEYPVIGIDDHFIEQNRFEVSGLLPEFEGDSEKAFEAMKENRNYVIADSRTTGGGFGPPPYLSLNLGEVQEVILKDGSRRDVKVIGFIDTFGVIADQEKSLNGIFIYEPYLEEDYNVSGVGIALFKLKDTDDNLEFRQDMERSLLSYGAQSVDFKKESVDQLKEALQIFNILNAYLGLGLLVGIAGLGIITLRSVNERKGQIGMMRAIGYNKRQVMVSFLIESTYISFLGIIIGIILGLSVSFSLFTSLFEDQGYNLIIPGGTILTICLIALGMTLMSTIPPSRMASRIAPAEVLRYE